VAQADAVNDGHSTPIFALFYKRKAEYNHGSASAQVGIKMAYFVDSANYTRLQHQSNDGFQGSLVVALQTDPLQCSDRVKMRSMAQTILRGCLAVFFVSIALTCFLSSKRV